MGEFPGSIDYFVDPSRVFVGQNSHSAIVIHGTGGNPDQTVEQLGDYFRTDAAITSSHYGIGRDGRVAQYVAESDGAAANCCVMLGHDSFWDQFGGDNLNIHTLSIEHENDLTNSLPLTDAQKATSFALVKYLCDKYNIPADNIKSHASIDPINRANCPGNYPWDELFAFLNNGGNIHVGIPQGWVDDGTTLTAPNGMKVVSGFRAHVLQGWDSANWPLEGEHGENPLELSNPSLGSGTQQIFRWTILEYTPQHGVFEAWGGQELLALRTKLASTTPATGVSQASVDNAVSALKNALQDLGVKS